MTWPDQAGVAEDDEIARSREPASGLVYDGACTARMS